MRVLTILLSVLPFGVQPAFSVAQTPPSAPQAQSISLGADGHLAYAPTAKGDHILDFSYAGYGGSDGSGLYRRQLEKTATRNLYEAISVFLV